MRRLLCATLALGLAGAVHAAGERAAAPALAAAYQQERAACMGKEGEDRSTCLREAGAALDEMRKGTLATGGDFERNRFARCERHRNAEDKGYCERRMRGEGTVSGSVAGGGLLRELVVTVPVD